MATVRRHRRAGALVASVLGLTVATVAPAGAGALDTGLRDVLVAAFDIATHTELWRTRLAGFHADHAALSPDGPATSCPRRRRRWRRSWTPRPVRSSARSRPARSRTRTTSRRTGSSSTTPASATWRCRRRWSSPRAASLSQLGAVSVVDYATATEVARVTVGAFPQRERIGRIDPTVLAALST